MVSGSLVITPFNCEVHEVQKHIVIQAKGPCNHGGSDEQPVFYHKMSSAALHSAQHC